MLKTRYLRIILLCAMLYQTINIHIYKNRYYPDAIHEFAAGREFLQTKAHVLLDGKFYFTTAIGAYVYNHFGTLGVKYLHVFCFALLYVILIALGTERYSADAVTQAALLFSFYPGTSLNVIANEAADMFYAILLALGILVFLRREKAFPASLLLGIGFLFKYIMGVFFAGFFVYLLCNRLWKKSLSAVFGFALPFAIAWLFDPLILPEFIAAVIKNVNYSTWGLVFFKLISTGILPVSFVAIMEYRKNRNRVNQLFIFIPSAYWIYVIVSKNAYSASYIMSICMIFVSFVVASFLCSDYFSGKRRKYLVLLMIAYILCAIVIVQKNLHYDTQDYVNVSRLQQTSLSIHAARDRWFPG